jgi:hypothetical protein
MNYEINTRGVTLESIGTASGGVVDVKIKGFWSGSTITLYVQRGFGGKALWNVSVSVSSGGRDTKEVTTDAEAYTYFAEALIAATELAKAYEASTDVLESFYQKRAAKDRAEFEAERALQAAKVEADTPMGEEKAKQLVARMVSGEIQLVTVFARGNDRPSPLSCTIRAKAKLYFCGGIIARAEAIRMLAGASARTHVAH